MCWILPKLKCFAITGDSSFTNVFIRFNSFTIFHIFSLFRLQYWEFIFLCGGLLTWRSSPFPASDASRPVQTWQELLQAGSQPLWAFQGTEHIHILYSSWRWNYVLRIFSCIGAALCIQWDLLRRAGGNSTKGSPLPAARPLQESPSPY